MEPEADVSALICAFQELDRNSKAVFLLRVLHEETIHARAAYVVREEGGDAVALRRSNERVHRLCGYALQVLTSGSRPEQDASFMGMIVAAGRTHPDRLRSWLADRRP